MTVGPAGRGPSEEAREAADPSGRPGPGRKPALDPVSRQPETGAWIVRRWELGARVLRDDERFDTAVYERLEPDLSRLHAFIAAPEARHRRLRSVMARAFSVSRSAELARSVFRPAARQIASDLPVGSAVDPIDRYVRPYQHRAVCGATGVGLEAGAKLVAAIRVARRLADRDGAAGDRARAAARLVLERAREIARSEPSGPGDGSSGLLAWLHRPDTPDLPPKGRADLICGFFETLAVSVRRDLPAALLRAVGGARRRTRRKLASEPAALLAAADETIRLQEGSYVPRTVARDCELGEKELETGDLVLVLVSACNRDPRRFPDPDRFDPWRENVDRHMGLGLGKHACVGRHVAKAMAAEASRALLERTPDLEWWTTGDAEERLALRTGRPGGPTPVGDDGGPGP